MDFVSSHLFRRHPAGPARQSTGPPSAPVGFRLIAMLVFLLSIHGCAVQKSVSVKVPPAPSPLVESVEQNEFPAARWDEIVGRQALVRIEDGDTLPDVARHFSLGIDAIGAANPGVDVWAPAAGAHVLLPLSFILPDAPRKGIVINLAAMRLFQFREGAGTRAVTTYPVGIGTVERPSPMGRMHVERRMTRPTWHVPDSIAAAHRKKGDPLPAAVPPGPLNPLGEHALYLSRAGYLIHGTNKPSSIGLQATNGCIRLYPEDIRRLYESTPVRTPVLIVNQPYLVGRRNGVVYLEVHKPPESSATAELKKAYAKLRGIEKKSGHALDWSRVEQALAEGRGIPVAVSGGGPGSEKEFERPVEVRRPGKFIGKPEMPELTAKAWYVLSAETDNRTDAVRIAAIISHQGPPIPARVLPKGDRYRVIAGPFGDFSEAGAAARRLKLDLGIDGIMIEPDMAK